MLFRKKKKPVDFEREVKLDIAFKAIFIYGFILAFVIFILHGKGWDTPLVTALLFGIYVFLIAVAPHWFYDVLKPYYGIFDKKLSKVTDIKVSDEQLGKMATTYNIILFLFLSFTGYITARAITYAAFNKNSTVLAVLIVVFDGIALWASISITNKRLKEKKGE